MHTFLTMIIEESVCFMSCEPIFVVAIILMWYKLQHLCQRSFYKIFVKFRNSKTMYLIIVNINKDEKNHSFQINSLLKIIPPQNVDAEVSAHTFLTMIIEDSVCFMSCEPIFVVAIILMWYTRNIYIYIFHLLCAWAIISPKEFKSCVTRISFALLYWKTELSAIKYFAFALVVSEEMVH
jgi:hypothetical protein